MELRNKLILGMVFLFAAVAVLLFISQDAAANCYAGCSSSGCNIFSCAYCRAYPPGRTYGSNTMGCSSVCNCPYPGGEDPGGGRECGSGNRVYECAGCGSAWNYVGDCDSSDGYGCVSGNVRRYRDYACSGGNCYLQSVSDYDCDNIDGWYCVDADTEEYRDGYCDPVQLCEYTASSQSDCVASCQDDGDGTYSAKLAVCSGGRCNSLYDCIAGYGCDGTASKADGNACAESCPGDDDNYCADSYSCLAINNTCIADGSVPEGGACDTNIQCSDATYQLSCHSGVCRRDNGEVCTSGDQCGLKNCISNSTAHKGAGTCQTPSASYYGHLCSYNTNTPFDNYGIILDEGGWYCDSNEVALGSTYQAGCFSPISVSYGSSCDTDVSEKYCESVADCDNAPCIGNACVYYTGGFFPDGVCGGTGGLGHDTCYTDYASDSSSSITPSSVFGTEAQVCDDPSEQGNYCDDISDGSFTPNNSTCFNSLCIAPNSRNTGETCANTLQCVNGNSCTAGVCLRDNGQSCTTGIQCISANCISDSQTAGGNGFCQSPSGSYDGYLCSKSAANFENEGVVAQNPTGGTWSCDSDDVATVAGSFYDSCSYGAVADGSACEADVSGAFVASGLCGGAGCCENEYVDVNDDSLFNDDSCTCGPVNRGVRCDTTVGDSDWDGICRFDIGGGADECTPGIDTSSTLDDVSMIDNSTITNSIVINSTIAGSTVIDSTLNLSRFYDSLIFNSNICSGSVGYDAKVMNDVLIAGTIIRSGVSYYAPLSLQTLCAGSGSSIGYVTFNESAISDGMPLRIYYTHTAGLSATVDFSNLGGGAAVVLHDDGTNGDATANDGVYTAALGAVATGNANEVRSVDVDVVGSGESWTVQSAIIVDNTDPSGTLEIYDASGNEDTTPSPYITLEMTYTDDISVAACRLAQGSAGNLASAAYEACSGTRLWALPYTNGTHYIFLEVRDIAGNTFVINDSIVLDSSLSSDTTPPTPPVVLDDGTYISKGPLAFRWYNSTDQEQALLYRSLSYDYWLYNGSVFSHHGQTTDQNVTITNITITHATTYTLYVSAFNDDGLYSPNATSDGITADLVAPTTPLITSSADPNTWNTGTTVFFNMSASDADSGIAGYSITASSSQSMDPDAIIDTNFTAAILPTSGYYIFKARAIDNAGNLGPVANYSFKIDNTPPSIPQMLEYAKNASGSASLIYSWTPSHDITDIVAYEIEVALDAEFSSVIDSAVLGNVTNYTYSPTAGETSYFARIRAQNEVGLWSLYSNELSGTVDLNPPVITFKKPWGVVVSTEPILVVETDENAYCSYNSSLGEQSFDITNQHHHEAKLGLADGASYSFRVTCTDYFGNTIVDTLNFAVDTSRVIDTLQVVPQNSVIYKDEIATVNVTISEGGTGLGEIPLRAILLSLDGTVINYADQHIGTADLGDGEYRISFIPERLGDVTAEVSVAEISDSVSLKVKELTLESSCDPYCSLLSEDTSFVERQKPYAISLIYPDIPVCAGSLSYISASDCIVVENIGDGKVCVGITSECENDKVIVTQ